MAYQTFMFFADGSNTFDDDYDEEMTLPEKVMQLFDSMPDIVSSCGEGPTDVVISDAETGKAVLKLVVIDQARFEDEYMVA